MRLDESNLNKLKALNNKKVIDLANHYIELCKPAKVTVLTDSKEDIEYARQLSLKNKEEFKLKTNGHTYHFDGANDQGRDKKNTCILLPKGKRMTKSIATIDRDEGLKEVFSLMDGIMKGKEMLICFYCLGPTGSKFSIPAMQITDSAYVAHSESILYRSGYEQFKKLNGSDDFFFLIHSSGEVDERGNSKNLDKRRIFMDLEENRVFTVNNQYAGNSVGLKKLSLRLAINKANNEDWLSEHMFLMGVHPQGKNRVTYFSGAFPSACGKTSTAMIPGQSIIGDDIAYLRLWNDGSVHAVNVEQGIFGIIQDVNKIDDPVIYKALTTPRELIFSNVLIADATPYWLGMGKDIKIPEKGQSFSGEWSPGKKGADGKDIPLAHPNARYTIRIKELDNANKELDNPEGVPVSGVIYGGRDSDVNVPICESFNWQHGVFVGACLESETTTANIGQTGIRTHDPMANIDFLVVPYNLYVSNHLKFGKKAKKCPKIFTTNYFLKTPEGKWVNEKVDKKVWVLWAEGRVHGDYKALETPVGLIPQFDDIKALFKQIFNKDYTKEDYEKQFSIRVARQLEKLDRMEAIFKEEEMPKEFVDEMKAQRSRLNEAKAKHGDLISPFSFAK